MRQTNLSIRSREYLTEQEIEGLLLVAKANKDRFFALRDYLAILLSFRHGLRVSELIALRWQAIDFDAARIHIQRLKNGTPGVHPLQADELRGLKSLRKFQNSPWIFTTKSKVPVTRDGIAKMLRRITAIAKLEISTHPHMFRHSCGFYLASKGYDPRLIQEYLGHKSIQHSATYTALSPGRFEGLWE
ncbi:MAG: tyrosine-type recombinase/integrase [Microcoleus sp. PH2017_10_PVI_O_A]|uniref:tyrosine-type recombinase/integrase n=1 Tax=unclassified Microcoleus TaxID=2642155 RepID=UPI001D402BFA|nr:MULTISPECIES: tyrosine-type recombinase/integrase [unclassified Microcoleus]MCC3409531.1 tyrosine-type recombinase/integrase [Microcoleus sp. PH2017_10_PVI_O_A]MCC3463752.1 tyrosine-type recombinase/integrase [Microcoleus sp. PH2017_11_PCY_U_A]MCC3482107.1 tyrosine-type recombinase/integrase [Microcoleus sp. PH2017_12_PCY_D_A]MCC3527731.1 tyrosine-type recombinase/integrase [Microcoleus sp. PH2017_21_RUC_O_A]MCC3542056.1 tyrosine-type recombinase/integrase [Microcoleus sp. PH2017_22_RUC_O_B